MDITALNQQIRAILAEFSGKSIDGLCEDQDLFDSGILDSFGIVALIGALEQHFEISITGDELIPQNFWTIAAINQTVRRKLGT